MQVFVWTQLFNSSWQIPMSMIAGSYGKNMFSFVRNSETVFQRGCTIFSFPPALNETSCCSTSLPAFGVVTVPDFGPSNRCWVVSPCCLNLCLPYDNWRRAFFLMLICHLYIFVGDVSVKTFASFLIELFSYCCILRVLCIFFKQFLIRHDNLFFIYNMSTISY